MVNARHFFTLVVIAAGVAVLAAYSLMETDPLPESGSALYPRLLDSINEVAQVEVTSQGQSFVLERGEGGRWVAPGRGGFPLDGDKVHTLLVGTAGLTRIEPKTASPDLYAQIGVEDPSTAEAGSVGYALRSASGETLADFIVGNSKPAKSDPGASEYFVRESGDAQSWLVEGSLPRSGDTIAEWLAREIARISSDRIEQVQITHPSGERVTVRKAAPGARDFEYVEAPQGREVKDTWRLNDIGRVLGDLELEDVRSAAEAGERFANDARRVEVRTYDGLVVRMEVVSAGDDEHLARLEAEFDEAQAKAGAALGSDALSEPEAVRKEAAELDERWKPWVYVIPRYKADYLSKTAADLLPAPETSEPKPEGDAGAGAPRS